MTLPTQCRSSLSWVVCVDEEARLARLGSASPRIISVWFSSGDELFGGLTDLSFLMVSFNFLFQERRFKVHDGRKRRAGKSEADIVAHF